MVACHDRYEEKCVFVAYPKHIIETYKGDMEYTDFAKGETRWRTSNNREEIAKYNKVRSNAQKIIDILTTD